jgi:hypothetical protein
VEAGEGAYGNLANKAIEAMKRGALNQQRRLPNGQRTPLNEQNKGDEQAKRGY